MKVVSIVRARDEEANIGRFCEAYQNIADLILVADGGSEDRTVEIAESYPKVRVLHFEERMDVNNDIWINPQGKHVNFLIRAAIAEGADWIIFDDCDCVPNFLLRADARNVMSIAKEDAVFVRRVYFWGKDHIFPNLHAPNTGLWAWRADLDVRADETDPWHLTMRWHPHLNLTPLRPDARHAEFPYCLLHYSWPTPEEADAKVEWYRKSGVQPGCVHPQTWAGPTEPATWFMCEELPDDKPM